MNNKGNVVVNTEAEIPDALKKLGVDTSDQSDGYEVYAEKWANFTKELAVMIVRTADDIISYPVVETIQQDSICSVVIAPAQISPATQSKVTLTSTSLTSFTSFSLLSHPPHIPLTPLATPAII